MMSLVVRRRYQRLPLMLKMCAPFTLKEETGQMRVRLMYWRRNLERTSMALQTLSLSEKL
jgi:hypothetical protein